MSPESYPITGIHAGKGANGSVPARQEITEWSSKPENSTQVNLYLLALRRLQDKPPAERDSWFQIAGIHGMPFKGWDEPNTTKADAHKKGYCTHANPLFPVWHRPYLMLLENKNQLYDIMKKDIIPQVPEDKRATWVEAADTWRLPYWDWAAHPEAPKLASRPLVTVTMPNGGTTEMDNPLYQFRMPNDKLMGTEGVESKGGVDYGATYATSRCPKKDEVDPKSKAWIEGVVNTEEITARFASHEGSQEDFVRRSTSELVYRLFTHPLTYTEFATVAVDPKNSRVAGDLNLEYIHNNIHWWVGGEGGHMSEIPVATFDPIFWLHHCNIDRLFATWQALNPDKWWESASQGEFDQKIIGLPESQPVTPTTPLRPFHKDKAGNVWIPNEVRDHFKLGYTYTGLTPWDEAYQRNGSVDLDAYRKAIMRGINDKYGEVRRGALDVLDRANNAPPGIPSGSSHGAVAIAIADNGPATAIARSSGSGSTSVGPSPVPGGMKVTHGGQAIESNDFSISLRFSRFAFGGHPFAITVHLAPPPESGTTRDSGRDYIGSVYNFSQPAIVDGEEVCSNCTTLQRDDVKMSAYLPVNLLLAKLMEENGLSSLTKEDVSSVLGRLYWRVKRNGKEVPNGELSALALEVIVSINTATHFKDSDKGSSFENFVVIPSLGNTSSGDGAGHRSGGSGGNGGGGGGSGGGGGNASWETPSSTQYLAIDKTLKLNKQVDTNGSISVQSFSIDLDDPRHGQEDSTGISFMHFDESKGGDTHKESDYDVVLSISIRRGTGYGMIRLNDKPSQQGWGYQDDFYYQKDWFRSKKPIFKVDLAQGSFRIYIDDLYIRDRSRRLAKPITHVQYWVKQSDLTTSALSHALTVAVP